MYEYKYEQVFRPGEEIAMTESYYIENALVDHCHDYLEIAYIYSGNGFHILNGARHPIKKGDIFFIAKNSIHNFEADNENLKWLNIVFLPSAFNRSIVNDSNAGDLLDFSVFSGIFRLSKVSFSDISLFAHEREFHNLLFEMRREYFDQLEGYQEILKNYLSIILLQIFRILAKKPVNPSPCENNLSDMLIEHLKSHLSDENLRIDEIAKKAFVSPKYFPNLFKKTTGVSVTKFVHERKIEIAAGELANTDKTVLEIMTEVGYNDTKFFYKLFARYHGVPPGEYRKHIRAARAASTAEKQ